MILARLLIFVNVFSGLILPIGRWIYGYGVCTSMFGCSYGIGVGFLRKMCECEWCLVSDSHMESHAI